MKTKTLEKSLDRATMFKIYDSIRGVFNIIQISGGFFLPIPPYLLAIELL